MGSNVPTTRPGVPTWARGAADYLFGGMKGLGLQVDPITGQVSGGTGFLADALAGMQGLPMSDIMAMLGGPMAAAGLGGANQRQLAAQLTGEAIPGEQQIAGMSLGGAGGIGNLLGQVGGYQDAAQQIAQNINRGATGLQGALGQANTTLQNVMNPTAYNPLFQNAYANQIAPSTNAAFSSRGLGSSGANIAALQGAAQGLSDQFAQRQFQEQLQSQGMVGNLGSALGGLGVAGAQVPGAVFNQFMGGLGAGQAGLGQAEQNQLGPLAALGAGSQQFWQGVNNPLSVANNVYGISRAPGQALLGGLGTASGGIGGGQYHSILGIPK